MVEVGRASSLAKRKGAQPPPQFDGFGGGPSWSWLGHSGDVQHADRMSALALCCRLVVAPEEGFTSVVVLAEVGELLGPLGKVRSSTKPDSRLFGNNDSYWGLGKVFALLMGGFCMSGIWAMWLKEAGLSDVKGLLPVKAVPTEGSGDDSEVDSPPVVDSPKGCRTSRSLRK